MAGYEVFSAFYDALTENVEYAAWAEYILALFDRFSGKKPKTVLDLACGTGSLTEQLLKRGLRVIGVDGSAEMLASAQQKTAPFGKKVLLLCQDMCALELGGTVDGAVCMLDSFSHLTTTAAVKAALCDVADSLPVGGVLIFDVNTPYKHAHILGDNAYTFDCEDVFCAWQNTYFPHTREVRMELNFFVPTGEVYERYTEEVRERAYSEATWHRLLREAGFETAALFGERTFAPPSETEQRWVFVARKGRNE